MVRKLTLLVLSLLILGCDSIDTSLISSKEKLNSPNNKFTLYFYFIESSMAFGSGLNVIQIKPSDENCDYSERNFLRFGNDYPFWLKWKNKDTISVKCLADGAGLQDKQPFKKEVKKWKNWTFEVEYFSVYSTGVGGNYAFDNYSIDSNHIKFSLNEKLWDFKRNDVQISVDSNSIDINHFDTAYFNSKLGLSFTSYNFKGNFKKSDFIKQQVLIKSNE